MILGNKYKDLFLIILPGIFGIALAYGLNFSYAMGIYAVVLAKTFQWVDDGHVLSTFLRIYSKKEGYEGFFYLLFPISLILLLSGLIYYNYMYALHLLVYMELFHYVRQNQGFMKIYAKKSNKSFNGTNWFIVLISLTSLIAIHFNPSSTKIFGDDSIRYFLNPSNEIFLGLYYTTVVLFVSWLIYELILWKKGDNNLYKFLFTLVILFLYIYCCFFTSNTMSFIIPLVFSHGIPYLGLIYHGENKLTTRPRWVNLLLLLMVVFVGSFLVEYSVDFNKVVNGEVGTKIIYALSGGLLYMPFLFHYLTDGWIWTSKNKYAVKILKENK